MKFSKFLLQAFLFTVAFAAAEDDDNNAASLDDMVLSEDMLLTNKNCTDVEGKYFPNLDWLLKGYNLMKGDPSNPTLDPGFSLSSTIFNAPYKQGRRTRDCRYKVPDFMVITPHKSCQKLMKTKSTTNSLQLSTLMETKAKVGGGGSASGFKAMFTASAGFHASSKLFTEDAAIITTTEAQCTAYIGGIEPSSELTFSDGFLTSLEDLPEFWNEAAYKAFLEDYGTHYIGSGFMGAMFGRQSEVTSTARKALAKLNISVEAGAEASAKGVAMEAKQSNDVELKAAAAFNSQHTKTKIYSRGASLPRDGNEDEWYSQALDAPTPLEFRLLRLDNLRLPISDEKMTYLKRALNGYCNMLKDDPNSIVGSCEEPSNDERELPKDRQFTKCRPGYCEGSRHTVGSGVKSAEECAFFCNDFRANQPKPMLFHWNHHVDFCECYSSCDHVGHTDRWTIYAYGEATCPTSAYVEVDDDELMAAEAKGEFDSEQYMNEMNEESKLSHTDEDRRRRGLRGHTV
jgi:MAC/Perforin domain